MTIIFTITAVIWWLVVFVFGIPCFIFGKRYKTQYIKGFHFIHGKLLARFFIQSHIIEEKYIKPSDKVLDLGSGTGFRGQEIALKCHADVTLCDVINYNETNLVFKKFDGINLPFADKSFDDVLIAYVLHHAISPTKLLRQVKRICKSKVIIYDDDRTNFIAKVFTGIHWKMFNWFYEISGGGEFHSQKEWEEIFTNLGFGIEVSKSNWRTDSTTHPYKGCFFVLTT